MGMGAKYNPAELDLWNEYLKSAFNLNPQVKTETRPHRRAPWTDSLLFYQCIKLSISILVLVPTR